MRGGECVEQTHKTHFHSHSLHIHPRIPPLPPFQKKKKQVGQLRTENKRLNEALAETASLRERLGVLEATVEELEATRSSLGQLQGAHERTQREHASMSVMVARLEDKLRQVHIGLCVWCGVMVILVCLNPHPLVFTHFHIQIHAHTFTYTCIHTHAHTFIYTYTHTHMYSHVPIHPHVLTHCH